MNTLGNLTATEARSTFLGRLENAVSRLDRAADSTTGNAITLTGGWPAEKLAQEAKSSGSTGPAGVFGALEDIANTIHRICDRIEEANSAVKDRMP